jgi:hypothetical protein
VVAVAPIWSKNSSTRRDLPTPAWATIVTIRQLPAATAASNSATSVASSASRPTRAAAAAAGADLLDREQPIGGDALGLAFQLERLHRLDLDAVPDEPVRRLADQHLVLGRRLLEPRGDVDLSPTTSRWSAVGSRPPPPRCSRRSGSPG